MNAAGAGKTTKICNHCSKDMSTTYNICPHCGGQQKEAVEELTPECPRCKVSLKLFVCDSEEYDICPQCGGIWLDRGEFHLATREKTVYEKVEVNDEYMRPPVRDSVEYIPCVRCGKLMNRRNFGKISGVIIDRCRKHGVWLDAGELEKIQYFIADGGMDRSRDREIVKNRAMIKELAMHVDQNTFTQRLLHFWNFKRVLFRGWRH